MAGSTEQANTTVSRWEVLTEPERLWVLDWLLRAIKNYQPPSDDREVLALLGKVNGPGVRVWIERPEGGIAKPGAAASRWAGLTEAEHQILAPIDRLQGPGAQVWLEMPPAERTDRNDA